MPQHAEKIRKPLRGRAMLAIPIGWIVAVFLIDVLAPPGIHLGPLLVAAPAITPSAAVEHYRAAAARTTSVPEQRYLIMCAARLHHGGAG